MSLSFRKIVGTVLIILGSCALAFAGLLAWLEWGGRSSGGWLSDSALPTIARDVEIAMATSAGIGVIGVIGGLLLRRD